MIPGLIKYFYTYFFIQEYFNRYKIIYAIDTQHF